MKKKSKPLFSWENREEDLRRFIRYKKFTVMFYRTNLSLHSARVQQIVLRLLPFAQEHYPELDAAKTLLISKFHDDHEMVSKRGDVPLQLKLLMSEQEKKDLDEEELAAAEFLVEQYGNPKIQGHSYRDLLMHALSKDCPEAQLHSFADKLDGYGEALHEALSGNVCFVEPVINYVAKTFNDPRANFPLIARVFDTEEGPFSFPVVGLNEQFDSGLMNGRTHSPASILTKTGIPQYELWKEVTLELPNGLEALTEQKEPQTLHLVKPADVSETHPPKPALKISKVAQSTA